MEKQEKFEARKEVRKLARERIGKVPAGKVIQPKTRRRRPKHPKRDRDVWTEGGT